MILYTLRTTCFVSRTKKVYTTTAYSFRTRSYIWNVSAQAPTPSFWTRRLIFNTDN